MQYPDAFILVAAATGALLAICVVVLVRRRRSVRPDARTVVVGLRGGLQETRRRLRERLDAVLGTPQASAGGGDVYAGLEEVLLGADVGVGTTGAILNEVRARVGDRPAPEVVRGALRQSLLALLPPPSRVEPRGRPWVILVTGVNGVGKTTTIGKLARRHVQAGRRVLLVAGDTFRAAAIDQLAVWAHLVGAEIVRHQAGGDPSAVAFDGMRAAASRGVDVVLVDSAGRLHTHGPLMEELRKVSRVLARSVPGAPHETLLVLDATTGQNAVSQARIFKEAVDVTGIVLTKLDGTARGGVGISICHQLGLPLRYVGVGERAEDLQDFDPREFVEALLGEDDARDVTGTLTAAEAGH
jgi:fused signal recognition particle receptor